MRCRVVKITTDLASYPQCQEDNLAYPDLVNYLVEDEYKEFVVDLDSDNYWPADEFFDMVDVRDFITHEPPEAE